MTELWTWVKQRRADRHSCIRCWSSRIFVVVFLEIHPFQDGNGRLEPRADDAAAVASRLRLRPLRSLESVIEHNKEAYYLALRQTQGTIAVTHPIGSRGSRSSCARWQSRSERLEQKARAREAGAGGVARAVDAHRRVRPRHGRVTIGQAIRLTGTSRNTLKQHFRHLVERGQLSQHGSGRGVWYQLR